MKLFRWITGQKVETANDSLNWISAPIYDRFSHHIQSFIGYKFDENWVSGFKFNNNRYSFCSVS